jgi:hypothetical protein
VADVGAHECRFGAESAQFSDQRLTSIVPSTGNYDARTFLSKRESGRAADTREASRDQNDWLVHCPTPDERLIDINSLMTGIAIDQLLHGGHRGLP